MSRTKRHILRATTCRAIARTFAKLDYKALGDVYCDEGGEAFWKAHPGPPESLEPPPAGTWVMYLPVAFLAMLTLTIGLFPGIFYDVALQAADQLLNPEVYRTAVLGPLP